jgi:branched-chain amino acid transport system substrate-binding protein
MKQAGCTRVAVANDKTPYGAGLATLLELTKGLYGITITSNTGIDPKAPNYRSYAATIKGQGANCFEFAGIVSNGGVQITKDVHTALPAAKIFGPDGMCTSSWTAASAGGVPASIDPLIECTVATQNLTAYPGGKKFLAEYQKAYPGPAPDPYAIYGYEAMELGLNTIASLGANGDNKADVLKALFAVKDRSSVLGTYGFDKNGDTTLTAYGLYKVGSNGDPVFYKTITPTQVYK